MADIESVQSTVEMSQNGQNDLRLRREDVSFMIDYTATCTVPNIYGVYTRSVVSREGE
jgi:hypothetical protein